MRKDASLKDISKVLKEVKKLGGVAKKWHARGNAGVHDRIVLFPNDEIWLVEVKAPDGKKSVKQREFHKQLYDMGYGRNLTVWCYEDIDTWLLMRQECIRAGAFPSLKYDAFQPVGTQLMTGRIKR